MGIYFNPPLPHVGAAQPLTPKKLTPPQSGPPPQNPPLRSAALAAALIATTWAPTPPLPPTSPKLVRAAPAVAAYLPPGPGVSASVLAWYQPKPAQPPVAINLDPPLSGPLPQNPPFAGGARVPGAALAAWIPPPPRPPSAINLDPPISGPIADNPLFSGGTDIVFLDAAPLPQVAARLTPPISAPQTATYTGLGSQVPVAVSVAWGPPPPQAPTARLLTPPISGPTPDNPPFGGRLTITWPDASTAYQPTRLLPPLAVAAQYLPPAGQPWAAIEVAWLPPAAMPPKAAALTPPVSGPTPQAPPRQNPNAPNPILTWWLPPTTPPALVSYTPITPAPPTNEPKYLLTLGVH